MRGSNRKIFVKQQYQMDIFFAKDTLNTHTNERPNIDF